MKSSQKRNKKIKSTKEIARKDLESCVGGRNREAQSIRKVYLNAGTQGVEWLAGLFLTFVDDINYKSSKSKNEQKKIEKQEKRQKMIEKKKVNFKGGRAAKVKEIVSVKEAPDSVKIYSEDKPQTADQAKKELDAEENFSNWDLPRFMQYLQHCYANNLLTPEQIRSFNEWIGAFAQETENYNGDFYDVRYFEQENSDQVSYPLNCTHVQISYYIWDKQNRGFMDPTEIGRRYKELYFNVL